jgi:hypothetical protein
MQVSVLVENGLAYFNAFMALQVRLRGVQAAHMTNLSQPQPPKPKSSRELPASNRIGA